MFSAALILSSQQLSLAVPWLLLKVCFFYFSAISCSVLRAPEHGELNCSHLHGNFTFGSTCNLSCQPGFELLGPQSRECMPTRAWTGDTSRCKGRAAAGAHSVTNITCLCCPQPLPVVTSAAPTPHAHSCHPVPVVKILCPQQPPQRVGTDSPAEQGTGSANTSLSGH